MMDDIETANAENERINEQSTKSAIDPNLSITHKLPESEDEKTDRAIRLIDEIVSEKLKPIEAQLKELPGLIKNTVLEVLQYVAKQQPGTTDPQLQSPNTLDNTKLESLATLLQAVAPIFSKGESGSANESITNMIIDSYMKRMKMDIDAQFMATYNKQVIPPTWKDEDIPRPKKDLVE